MASSIASGRREQTMRSAYAEQTRKHTPHKGTFLEDATPIEYSPENDDMEDPHDLSLSARHAPRASMVDNLVMSLDQFSHASLGNDRFSPRNNSYDGGTATRGRGHTFSSSVSSESDVQDLRNGQQYPRLIPPLPRRNSSKYKKNLQKLPSIFGEDEDSVRVQVYDRQRAEHPLKPRPRKGSGKKLGRSSNSSTSSSIDLGHLQSFAGRLGPAGNRRSRSFDFGSSQRNNRSDSDAIDVAPNPIIYSGPEAQSSPTKANFNNPPLVRKNSTKSSKSTYARKPRAGTMGNGTSKPSQEFAPPPMPQMRTASEHKFSSRTNNEHIPTSSKPGFFRRVFGSSKSTALHSEFPANSGGSFPRLSQDRNAHGFDETQQSPATPAVKLQKSNARISTDIVANKENQPTVTKKSSAFFRRRKKSVSNNTPPPLPLTLNDGHRKEIIGAGAPSPVSSLRAFMDPYLAGNVSQTTSPPSAHRRTDSKGLSTFNNFSSTSDDTARGVSKFAESGQHARNKSEASLTAVDSSRKISSLRIPHQDSFLADSSSAEEPSRRSPRDVSPMSDGSRSELRLPYDDSMLKTGLTDTTDNVSVAEKTYIPELEPRQEVLKPPQAAFYGAQPSDPSQRSVKPAPTLDLNRKDTRVSPRASISDISIYKSAPTTPMVVEGAEADVKRSPFLHVSHPSLVQNDLDLVKEKARKIFDNDDDQVDPAVAAAWLGESGIERERVRDAYMDLFDWTNQNILSALRSLCDRIVLKGETQQMDRVLDAFAQRWCACNSNHGFKSSDVVHTICYSVLLLNTDLHLADIGQKMTRTQFVRNALPTVKRVAEDSSSADKLRSPSPLPRSSTFPLDEAHARGSVEHDNSNNRNIRRPVDRLIREDSGDADVMTGLSGPLVEAPYNGSDKGWENQIDGILRSFYSSISQEPLPLFGSQLDHAAINQTNSNLLSISTNVLRRTPSVLSKAQSDTYRNRLGSDSRSLGARWVAKARSRPRLPSAAGFNSSRTSLDEQSSAWSPSMSSTWSKASLGKTLTSVSVDSFRTAANAGDYQSSIGFANALSQAIIRDDQLDAPSEDGLRVAPLLEDESLELAGAPWAKEGILKHKCHLEGVDKRSKDRNWEDCFAVIEKGWMRLFSFSMTAKSLRQKAKSQKPGAVVGGGNWQDNASEIWKFMLRHAIASSLPAPGYSKARPYVWALSLPTGAVHLFSVGTPEIVKEFVSTANYWSARLSKEPMMGGISNMEYGWSDSVINRALIQSATHPALSSVGSPRPSTQMSIRSSFDQSGNLRPKLPGDRTFINEWTPPQQTMVASQLMEVDQLKALQTYVSNVEDELSKHNELRGPMLLAFTSRHPNSTKAMNNWEKKSSYLLREIVKFRTYIDTLQHAQATKDQVHKQRRDDEDSRRTGHDSSLTLTASATST